MFLIHHQHEPQAIIADKELYDDWIIFIMKEDGIPLTTDNISEYKKEFELVELPALYNLKGCWSIPAEQHW